MAKQKRKAKEGMQVSLFEQEVAKPVDLHKEPPEIIVEQKMVEIDGKMVPYAEASLYRPRVVIGSTKSCPVCGEDIKLSPDGTVKCTKCWWWQGVGE